MFPDKVNNYDLDLDDLDCLDSDPIAQRFTISTLF